MKPMPPHPRSAARLFERQAARPYRLCARCIMDTSDPEIEFDASGVCGHCRAYDATVAREVVRGEAGMSRLTRRAEEIREAGRGRRYDCVIGLSGGVDSSFVAYLARKRMGLRPLAIHMDNGWNSEVAVRNIENVVRVLDIDLHTEVLDWEEFRRLQLAFLRAGTPDLEIPTDHAIVATLYRQAEKWGVKWIVEGVDLVTELMIPATWSHGHGDWRYIRHVNDRFGGAPLATYPHYTPFQRHVRFGIVRGIRHFAPLHFADYDRAEAMRILREELGWQEYGGKHHESIYTRFYQGYMLPRRFGFDKRRPHLSCLINAGQTTRARALEELERPAIAPAQLAEDRAFVIKKLGIDESELERLLSAERRTFWDYPSYESDPKVQFVLRAADRFLQMKLGGAGRWLQRTVAPMLPRTRDPHRGPRADRQPRESDDLAPDTPRPVIRPASTGRGHGRTAWILALTAPVDEPRVRRQADALSRGGWNVVVVGYRGLAEAPAFWTLVELPESIRPGRRVPRPAEWLTPGPYAKLFFLALARWSGACAERYYWMEGRHRENFEAVLDTVASSGIPCDLVAHHDFDSLGIAARLSGRLGVPFTTDAHEYAREQAMHTLRFRLLTTHYVHSLQQRLLPRAALVTVVCEGIANLLGRDYALRRPPLVVRNVSPYEPMAFRPAGERIRVTYHGIVQPTRGLEEAIRSLPLWRGEFELVIRGPGPEDYVDALRRLARACGVESRVRFAPVVPLTRLVAAANECDIGFFASPGYSSQKRFAAPNKLFEYLMAGLAVCVSDLPEMRRVVVEHDIGRLFASLDPESIAAAINGFDRAGIDRCKKRSLEAARILCWERERQPLIDAYSDTRCAGTGARPRPRGPNGEYQPGAAP